jgi:hypothetical protein
MFHRKVIELIQINMPSLQLNFSYEEPLLRNSVTVCLTDTAYLLNLLLFLVDGWEQKPTSPVKN